MFCTSSHFIEHSPLRQGDATTDDDVESGAENEMIQNEVQTHERLWSNTWLVDDAYKTPSKAWQKVKDAL